MSWVISRTALHLASHGHEVGDKEINVEVREETKSISGRFRSLWAFLLYAWVLITESPFH